MTDTPTADRPQARTRDGAILPLVAICLPLIIILAGLAVNVALMDLHRTSLRVSTDAATRAASRTYAMTGDTNQAVAAAQQAGQFNEVAGQPLMIAPSDIDFGQAHRAAPGGRYVFTSGAAPYNSVKILAQRDAAHGGAIPMLFSAFLGSKAFEVRQQATASQSEMDVILVLDRSGSMAYGAGETADAAVSPASAPGWSFGDPAPSDCRWRDLLSAVAGFADELDQTPLEERLGVVSYSHTTTVDSHITADYTAALSPLNVYTSAFESGGTAIGDGLYLAKWAVTSSGSRPSASKVLVVMTDGIQNYGASPTHAATSCLSSGIHVYTVTFSDEADQTLMSDVANLGGGRHYHATDVVSLDAAFREIAASLPTLLVE